MSNLYRFHFDLSGFNFPDWDELSGSIFKGDASFTHVVFEIAKDTRKKHWQGVCAFEVTPSTITSRIKRHKRPDAKKGCYSFTKQKPNKVDGYYNYLCKGDFHGQYPKVIHTMFDEDEILRRHNAYWLQLRTFKELDADVEKLAIDYTRYYNESVDYWNEQNGHPDAGPPCDVADPTSYTRQLWLAIVQKCTDHLMNTCENGFIPSQISRLSLLQLSKITKTLPDDNLIHRIQQDISRRTALSMVDM